MSYSYVNMDSSKLAEIKQQLVFNDRVVKAQVMFCSDVKVFIIYVVKLCRHFMTLWLKELGRQLYLV